MADKNQLKIADQIDFSEDDPFAELTRIMGFDPRQPARQAAAAPAPQQAQVEQAAQDDFSLDLEKELLGGFDLDDSEFNSLDAPAAEDTVSHEEPSLEAPAVEASPAVSESEMAEVEFDFSGAFESALSEPEVAAEPELQFDGDLDAAFAATAGQAEIAESTDDMDFDLGLTDEEVRALDAPSPLPVTPQAVVESRDPQIDADLYAAMADIDMDFLDATPAVEPVAAAPAEAAAPSVDDAVSHEANPETDAAEMVDADADFFDESDFHFEDETAAPVAPEAVVHAEPAAQPEIDESVFEFAADDFQVEAPAPEGSEQHEVEAFSFDDVDLEMEDVPAVEADAPEEARVEALPVTPEPVSSADFQLSVPAYVPRKLPVSPMDVAAEEYRQREAVAAPAPQDFNLEDELNALLGNVRSISKAAPVEEPPVAEAPAYDPPAAERYEPAVEHYEPAVEQPIYRAPEPVAFDAPEHPADIDDNLNWEFEDAFAAEAAADDLVEPYAEQEQFDADAYQPEQPYAPGNDEDELSQPIDLDAAFEQIAAELRPADPAPSYGDALAGAAVGAAGYAAARSSIDFGARSYEPAPRAPVMDSASPHRDPVVRGNPLKEDPLDIITQLAAKYSKKEPITSYGRDIGLATGTASAYAEADRAEDDFDLDLPDTFEAHPEVETVEVADHAIALADDLDIPELPEEEDLPAASYDDLDTEFSSLLTDMNNEPQAAQDGYDDPLAGDAFSARPFENANHARNGQAQAASYHADAFSLDADDLPGSRVAGGYGADAYEYDPEYDQDIPQSQLAAEARRPARPRALLIAGIVGGVALIGALGAFALSFGGDAGSDTPALVKADDGPIKVKPENTGGRVVPNQESKVYDTVSGEGAANAPQQEKLVTTAEEPVDVTPPPVQENEAATGKSEDRIEQIVQDVENVPDSEIVAVTPRKVRTMVVKPDGTLVPREDEPEAAPSNEQTDTIAAATPEAAPAPAIPEATGALPATAAPAPDIAPAAPEELTETAAAEPASDDAGVTPETAPIVPLRPADQPIDVVGEVKPDQVAAATTATASVGNWAMQIASQPSEAAAQSSYQDLARRYSSVLQGREVNIVKAEISGKGTFWRVRVPAPTRQEAIGLCESYKSVGGNCFVSK
jgi:hypothetical protein